jgi:hypothetical protein
MGKGVYPNAQEAEKQKTKQVAYIDYLRNEHETGLELTHLADH